VGVSKRVIVVDINSLEEDSEPVVLINPEITDTDGL
jgi:peptide deformylase